MADRVWDRAPSEASAARRVPAPLTLAITVTRDSGAPVPPDPIEEHWRVGANDAELRLAGTHLHGHIECGSGRFAGRVSAELVAHHPSLVARLLIETPVAALLARRAYCVLHAGVVVGPAGAVVIRGPAGAGKSTLVAAAHRWGLGVMGDESVLAVRSDPDELLAAVRDLTLLPDAQSLLSLDDALTAPVAGGEGKRRLDLFPSSTPALRRARRVATLLLGSRNGGAARIEPLTREACLREFEQGAIPQEQWSGTPPHIAEHWSREGAYRLSGAADLEGAVALLADLVSRPAAARQA